MTVPIPVLGDPHNIPLPHQWEEQDSTEPAQLGMDDAALLSLLQREEDQASLFRNSQLAQEQATALDYYDARPLGNEVEGQSQVVVPDVAETVDYMTISVARTFIAGDRIVEFVPRQPGQEEAAREATEAVSHAFMNDQDGLKVLIDWIQSGLIEKIGIVKTAVVTKRRTKRERLTVDGEQLAALSAGLHPERPGAQLMGAQDHGDGTFTASIHTPQSSKRYIDMPVPSEEFIFSQRARHEDDAAYIAQRSRKTRSDLVEMGFDRRMVDDLPADSTAEWWGDPRSLARWGESWDTQDNDGPLAEVTLLEEYVRADRDGDGIAELLQVLRVGDVIFEVSEVDEQPFVVFCPFPRAHRMVGQSLAEKVADIQALRTMVTRQTIDGVMLTNRPRGQIDENAIGESTIDDWLTAGPGVLIRTKGGGEIKAIADAFDPSQGLGLLQFLVGERESRTGITRLNQGLDADAISKTATGTAMMQAQGQQMEEYVARQAGGACGRLFAKKMRLMIAEGDPIMLRLDGEYRQANPTAWDGDMPVEVRVGLGTGQKAQRIQNWQLLIEDQNGLFQNGSPLVTPENMYRARDGAIRDMGLGTPNEFYTDPSTPEAQQAAASQPPKQDPKAIEAQGKAALAQQQAQQDHEQAMSKLQLQQQAQQAASDLETQKASHAASLAEAAQQHKQALAEQQQQAQAELAVRQQNADAALAERELQVKLEIAGREHEQRVQHASEAHEAKIASFRKGGDLDK
jgi:hypothetical protein